MLSTYRILDLTDEEEEGLFGSAFSANKRGITLNIEMANGRAIFRKLIKTSVCDIALI